MQRNFLIAALFFIQSLMTVAAQEDLDFLLEEEAQVESERTSQDQDGGIAGDQAAGTESKQSPEADITARKPRSRLVEEIVVTAQKREENLTDVPVSVQAFSTDLLDARGVYDAADLQRVTPSLTVTTQVGYTSTFLRGIGTDAFILADPSVVNYIDGVYFPFALTLVQDFGAVERVEVLKGPQGTLFGRNAIGGALNVITRDPSLEEVEVTVQSVYQTHDTFRNRAHISLPVTDTLAISVAGLYNTAESHIDGRTNVRPDNPQGDPLPQERSGAGRVKLKWQPVDWFQLNLGGYELEIEGINSLYSVNTDPTPVGQVVGIQPKNPYAGENNEDIYTDNKSTTYFGRLEFYTPVADFKILGSDQRIDSFQNYDFDGSSAPAALFEVDPAYADVQTAELQILSNDQSWGAEWLEWILGAYYFTSESALTGFFSAGTTDLNNGLVGGVMIPQPLLGILQSGAQAAGLPGGSIDFDGIISTDSIAYFGQATVTITDWFAVTLGARYQVEDREILESSSGLRNLDGSVTPIQNYDCRSDRQWCDTTHSFDPKISLDFRPASFGFLGEEPLVYLSYQTATKGSTYNVINLYDQPEYVKPEEMTAWELGIKTRYFDGLMSLNAAVFDYELKNLQSQFVSLFTGGALAFENAALAEVFGVDFDSVIQLFPGKVDNLVLTVAGAYVDSTYGDFRNASGFDPANARTFSQNNDYTGNQVVRSPKYTGSTGLVKTWAVPGGELETGVNYYYNSGFYYLPQGDPTVEEEAYDVVGVNLSYLYEPWNLRATLFGRNIFDEEYNISRFPTDFGTNDAAALKAVYGLRLNWDM